MDNANTETNENGFADTFERDDCGAYVYPNGFRFPLEDTGSISMACQDWHSGQWSDCYAFASSGHMTPSMVAGIESELSACETSFIANDPDQNPEALDGLYQALEDIRAWLKGVEDCLPD